MFRFTDLRAYKLQVVSLWLGFLQIIMATATRFILVDSRVRENDDAKVTNFNACFSLSKNSV